MKVTHLREMIFNGEGELEQMNQTHTIKRIAPQSPVQPQNIKLMAITSDSNYPTVYRDEEDRKSVSSYLSRHSDISYQSAKSRTSYRCLGDKKPVFTNKSQQSASDCCFFQQKCSNWKLYLMVIVFGLVVYAFWPFETSQKIEQTAKYEDYIIQGQMMHALNINNTGVSNQARELASLFFDQLLISDGLSIGLSQFRVKIGEERAVSSEQIWDQFQELLRENRNIKISLKGDETIGMLVNEI